MNLAVLLVTFAGAAPAAVALEDYFMVFTTDSIPYKATGAHTFAACVQIERAADGSVRVVQVASLSWLPETMKVRGLAMLSEKGRNVPLHETLEHYLNTGSRICFWGPYRVKPEFADTFRARVCTVESSFKYKGACLTSPMDVVDCARSVEEMIDPYRRYIGVCGYGAAAGSYIVRKFSCWMIAPEQTHPWVEALIGVDKYPLVHRSFGDYTSRGDQFNAWLKRK